MGYKVLTTLSIGVNLSPWRGGSRGYKNLVRVGGLTKNKQF